MIVLVLLANGVLDLISALAPRFLAVIGSSPIQEFTAGVFYISIAWGLWNLRKLALWITIPYLCYQLVDSTWFFFSPKTKEIASGLAAYAATSPLSFLHRFAFTWAAEVILEVAGIWFLFKWRSAFART